MSFTLILGNILSLLAVLCMGVSVVVKSKKALIGWQILDTVFFIASTLVLRSYSAVVANTVSLIRNIYAYQGRLTKKLTWVFCFLSVIIGLYLNNRGIIGWLPVVATLQYTVCLYITKNEQQMRYALAFNLVFWSIHDFYIQSYPSGINNVVLCFWSLFQAYKHRKVDLDKK